MKYRCINLDKELAGVWRLYFSLGKEYTGKEDKNKLHLVDNNGYLWSVNKKCFKKLPNKK